MALGAVLAIAPQYAAIYPDGDRRALVAFERYYMRRQEHFPAALAKMREAVQEDAEEGDSAETVALEALRQYGPAVEKAARLEAYAERQISRRLLARAAEDPAALETMIAGYARRVREGGSEAVAAFLVAYDAMVLAVDPVPEELGMELHRVAA